MSRCRRIASETMFQPFVFRGRFALSTLSVAYSLAQRSTVSDDDRLFVSAGFALMLLGARGVDSVVSPCYCCVCWRCARVVEGADCKSAHVGSSPTSVSGAASSRHRRVAGVVELACATYPCRPIGKTADFGSANTGSSPGRGAKGGCANVLPASTIDAPRSGREAHHL